ncbi:hypothetical protein MHBO_001956 [Bonamia ostreae]|uniref:Uncharacterized protein n=1 Tax=Bonamia ostreae TaxID=126728 RepID=A0ABV2AKR0_9EUKA
MSFLDKAPYQIIKILEKNGLITINTDKLALTYNELDKFREGIDVILRHVRISLFEPEIKGMSEEELDKYFPFDLDLTSTRKPTFRDNVHFFKMPFRDNILNKAIYSYNEKIFKNAAEKELEKIHFKFYYFLNKKVKIEDGNFIGEYNLQICDGKKSFVLHEKFLAKNGKILKFKKILNCHSIIFLFIFLFSIRFIVQSFVSIFLHFFHFICQSFKRTFV